MKFCLLIRLNSNSSDKFPEDFPYPKILASIKSHPTSIAARAFGIAIPKLL